jgi:peptide/nickel transport system permease protein
LYGVDPEIALFADPKSPDPKNPIPIKGTYQLVITGITWEKNSDISAEFVFLGQVAGLAGTDFYRRDLMVALLWGVPVALAFGLIASVGTSVLTMIIAAIGAWYGRWVDGLIQRITEVNLVLPFLPILIMIGTLFSRSIWVILGATVALSIFTGQIKAYRAIFMQVKETTYIEAAKAYGASNWRIISLYLIPRMIPTLIPNLVLSVPSFVFLEASLAVLGLGDPTLPTWGKIIDDAFNYGALYKGLYYWILEPAVLLMITGLAFALLGFALDRIFNPRLREA